jgi:hypothetical protein
MLSGFKLSAGLPGETFGLRANRAVLAVTLTVINLSHVNMETLGSNQTFA